jgi:hypothetical protein
MATIKIGHAEVCTVEAKHYYVGKTMMMAYK